jgi:hypothetical protein
MRLSRFLSLGYYLSLALALLEENIISFESAKGSVSLHDASIVYSADDPVGIEIAVTSLAEDLGAVTGTRPSVFKIGDEDRGCGKCADNTIIAATINSTLVKALVDAGSLDISAIDGIWESYQTSVVDNPIHGVKRALVIVGSDKRGTMFGVYTLSGQCGQSPYVLPPRAYHYLLRHIVFIGGPMSLRPSTRRSMPSRRKLRSGRQASSIVASSSMMKHLG